MAAREIGLVAFDWGGVLIRICRSLGEACTRVGIEHREVAAHPELRVSRQELSGRYQLGEMGCDAYFAAAAERTGGAYSEAEIRAIHDAWLIGEYDGVSDLIDEIHAAGVKTGLLSNTNASHAARQASRVEDGSLEFPAPSKLGVRAMSHELKVAKPEAGIYEAAAEMYGFAGREGELLFFDDLEENIEAARRLGWKAELIDHTGDTAAQMRAKLVTSGVLASRRNGL
ncbi:MAG: HAD-IA family hydrolase [Planctomycetota bacterium]